MQHKNTCLYLATYTTGVIPLIFYQDSLLSKNLFLWLCVSICHFMVKLVHCTCSFHLSNINCDVIIPFSSIYTRAAHTYTLSLSTLNWPTSQYGWNIMYPFCVLRYLNCNFYFNSCIWPIISLNWDIIYEKIPCIVVVVDLLNCLSHRHT